MSVTYTTKLQEAIDTAITGLTALRNGATCSSRDLYDSDPDSLRALAALSLELADVVDPVFCEIAYQGGLSSKRDKTSAYGELVRGAIEGNFDFDLTSRADQFTCEEDPRAVWAEYRSDGDRERAL